jgi:hypothetical protein
MRCKSTRRYGSRLSTLVFVYLYICLSARIRKRKGLEKSWLCTANCSSVWHTGLSGGAPDSVRCARLDSSELATLGKLWRRTTIIHRTVRWCTGLPDEPMAASATVGRAIRARRVAPANGRLGASDYPVSIGQCPVCTGQCPARQRLQFCNGRLCHFRKEIRTGP